MSLDGSKRNDVNIDHYIQRRHRIVVEHSRMLNSASEKLIFMHDYAIDRESSLKRFDSLSAAMHRRRFERFRKVEVK